MRRFLLLSLLVISTCAYAADDNDSLTATVTRMARIGRCTSPQFSPDGKTLAFRSDMSGVPQIWTVPVEGGWPHQITALDDAVDTLEWSPTSDWLALSVARKRATANRDL
jgi:Tol biopolymer transport system component